MRLRPPASTGYHGAVRVAMIASECEPWAKTGGLGDVVDALARALGRGVQVDGTGVDGLVDVFLPRYRSIDLPSDGVGSRTVRVPDPVSSEGATDATILSFTADGYRLRLVDIPDAYDRDGFYGTGGVDHPDNAWRFGMLCRAALETLRQEARPIDVVHVHDWQGAPAVLYRDAWYWGDFTLGRTAFVLTIHNPAYHGWTHAPDVWMLGLPGGYGDAYGLDLLRTAIERADIVNAVSPTFARESLTSEMGKGLEWALAGRGDRFIGIINGIDTDAWDPATDPALAAPYDASDLSGKTACRRELLAEIGFDPDDPSPVLGVVGRLDPQKGFDLVAGAAEGLIADGMRIVVLGTGDHRLLSDLAVLGSKAPSSLSVNDRFDRDLARRIYAGADLFLMPSRFEPCGQSQMIAMRYGTPPVVRRTGGLADTVIDADEDPENATGWAFDEATSVALAEAIRRASAAYAAPERATWDSVVAGGMSRDWSWEGSDGPAAGYLRAYARAISARR
jgi:starch synthase